ncbi:hypothetical protein Tco_0520897 [Tanacetum coccineum]
MRESSEGGESTNPVKGEGMDFILRLGSLELSHWFVSRFDGDLRECGGVLLPAYKTSLELLRCEEGGDGTEVGLGGGERGSHRREGGDVRLVRACVRSEGRGEFEMGEMGGWA